MKNIKQTFTILFKLYRSSYSLTLYYITKGGWKNSLPALSRGVCGVPPVLLLLLLPAIYATLLKDNKDQDNPLLRICTSLPYPSYPNSLSSHFNFFSLHFAASFCFLPICLFVPCPTWCFAVSVIFVSFQFTVHPYRSLSSHPVSAMSRNVAPRHDAIKISRFCLNLSKPYDFWKVMFLLLHLVGRYLADTVIQSDFLCTYDKFCCSNLMFCSLVQWW